MLRKRKLESEEEPDNPIPQYNTACLYALTSRPGEALRHLEASIENGFHDYIWMGRDPDLVSLRGLERFEQLRERAEELAKAAEAADR